MHVLVVFWLLQLNYTDHFDTLPTLLHRIESNHEARIDPATSSRC